MNYAIGMPKHLHVILEERGIDTKGMNGDQIHETLGSHEDFKMVSEQKNIQELIANTFCSPCEESSA